MTAPPLRAHVYVATTSNALVVEIATLLRDGLRDAGVPTDVRRGGVPVDEDGILNLVVAPHEFFALLGFERQELTMQVAAHCVLVMTERPDSARFRLGLAWARTARAVLGLDATGVARMVELGVEAYHLPLGYHRSWDFWRGRDGDRTLDVVFLGSVSERRRAVLASLASRLHDLDCRILLHDDRHQLGAAPPVVVGARKFELLSRTRVLLDVHRTGQPGFDWHRVMPALVNGCVVLTEAVPGFEPLVPGLHLAMATVDDLGDELRSLLAAERRMSDLRDQAYDLVRTDLDLVGWMRDNLARFERWAAGPGPPRAPEVVRALEEELRAGVRAMEDSQESRSAWEPPAAEATRRLLRSQAAALARLRQRVDALEGRLPGSVETPASTVDSPGYAGVAPEVSVIIDLSDGETTGETLASVAASTGIAVETVVVGDGADDASRLAVERFLAEHPEAAVRSIWLDHDIGMAASANLGVAEARGRNVFRLGTGDAVYPRALCKLSATLDAAGAAFSYSMVEYFGHRRWLSNVFPWDSVRRAGQPSIEDMMLIRKDVWNAVGGLATGAGELEGVEHRALLVRLADAGYEGVLVPEILCRRRLFGTGPMEPSIARPVETDVQVRFYLAEVATADRTRLAENT